MTVAHIWGRLGCEIRKLGFLRGNLRSILAWPVAGLLLIAIVWGITYYQHHEARQALRKNSATTVTALSTTYAEQLSRSLEQIDQITLNLKYYWKLSDGTLRLEDQLHEGLYPSSSLLYVTIIDRHGVIKTSTLDLQHQGRLGDSNYFKSYQNTDADQLQISKPDAGSSPGHSVIRFSRRLIANDGAFDGLVIVSVEPAYFATFGTHAVLGRHGFLSLRSKDGMLLSAQLGKSLQPFSSAFTTVPSFEAASGVAVMDKDKFFDLQPRLVAWQAVKNYPLISVAGLSEEEMLLPLASISTESRILAVGRTTVVLIFVLVGMLLSSRLAWRKHQVTLVREASGITTEGGNDGFFIWRAMRNRHGDVTDFAITDCNEHGASLYGLMKGELLGRRLSSLYENPAYFEKMMHTCIGAISTGFYEDDFAVPSESPLKMTWLHRKMMRSDAGLVITLRDISESKAHEEALSSMANSDALTGLPNRHWLMGYLPRAIESTRSSHKMLALLFVDLDDFKNINDTMGHAAGDELLQAMATRLRSVLRPADSIVRLGGDEFTIILEQPENATAVERVSERIIASLKQPFVLTGQSSHVIHASIGISFFPQDGDDAATLLKHADIAMYAAKANGKSGYQFFQPQLSQDLIVRLNNEQALRAAIDSDQFVLHYQPRVDATTGELRSLEALVRWNHPQRGMVPPDEFIPLAEETGLIVRLGEMVIEKACRQLADWKMHDLPLVPVSVNVSPRQFNQGNIEMLFALHMGRHEIGPELVEIELTESCMMGEDHVISRQLAAIKTLGVKLLIDDFGTGYSSLSQLQRLDLDILKIDKAFTSQLGTGREGAVFFKAIISMAQVLNIGVVAEGVETLQQLQMLQSLSCNEIQGYFISRPLPAAEAGLLMHKRFLFPDTCPVQPVLC